MKNSLFFCCLLFFFNATAQEVIKTGNFIVTFGVSDDKMNEHLWECATPNKKGGYTAVSNKVNTMDYANDIAVHIFDDKFNPINLTQTGKLKFTGKKVMTEQYLRDNGKIHWLFSTEDKNVVTLYCKTFDTETGVANEDKVILKTKTETSFNTRVFGGTTTNVNFRRFSWIFSPDSSKILASYFSVDNREQRNLIMMDRNFNVLWERTQEFPFLSKPYFNIVKYAVPFDAGAFDEEILNDGTVVNTCKFLKTGNDEFNYELHLLNKDSYLAKIPLGTDDKYVPIVELLLDQKGNIYAGGVAYKNKTSRKGEGFFIWKYLPESKSVKQNFYSFDQEIVGKYEKNPDKACIQELRIRHIVQQNDGSITLITEEQNTDGIGIEYPHAIERNASTFSANNPYEPSSSSQRLIYHFFGDIYLFNIGIDNKIQWTSKIPKTQVMVGEAGSVTFSSWKLDGGRNNGSFKLLTKPNTDDIFIIYTDHPKNIDGVAETEYKKYWLQPEGILVGYTIDVKNGKAQKQIICNNDDAKKIYMGSLEYLSPNKLISYYFDKKRNNGLVEIKLAE